MMLISDIFQYIFRKIDEERKVRALKALVIDTKDDDVTVPVEKAVKEHHNVNHWKQRATEINNAIVNPDEI